MSFLLPFTRSFYTFSLQVFDRPPSFWAAYYLDIVCFIYATPRLLFLTIVLKDKTKIAYFYSVDPAVHSFSTDGSHFLLAFVLIFEFFHIFCKLLLVRVNVNTSMWRFWRQVVVQLQDDYHRFALTSGQQAKLREVYAKKLGKKLKKSTIIRWLVPRLVLKSIVCLMARVLVWANFENVNERRFSVRKLFLPKIEIPNLSPAIRRRTVLSMLFMDKFAFVVQIVLCEF